MLLRITFILTLCLTAALAVLTIVSGRDARPATPRPDHVRLLDLFETAAELESPWTGVLRARNVTAVSRRPDWLALQDPEGLLASVQPRLERGYALVTPRVAGFILTWTLPVTGGKSYRLELGAGLRGGHPRWAECVTAGKLAAALRPTIRFPGVVARSGLVVTPAAPPRKTAPPRERGAARIGEGDPFATLREAARMVAANPTLRDVLWEKAESGRQLGWGKAAVDFTAPAGAAVVEVRLDAEAVVGPFALGLGLAPQVAEAAWVDAVAGSAYRYARTHGVTAWLKRVVETRDEDRLCLVLPPPAVVGIDVVFPAAAELVFGLRGLPPLGGAAVTPSRLVVEAEVDGVTYPLHHEPVTVAAAAADGWLERCVDCAAVAGRSGRLRIRVGGRTVDGAQVALSNPIVHRRGRGREQPSILLLTVDSLRTDIIGLQVDGRSITPHIDALVAESVRSSHGIAAGLNTYTSMPCVVTATPLLTPGAGQFAERPAPDLPTLADVLGEAGHFVGAFIPDYYMNSFLKGVAVRPRSPTATDADRVAGALRFLERHRDDPVFLWVHLDDPHTPWLPSPDEAPPWDIPGVADPGAQQPDARFLAAARSLLSTEAAVRAAGRRYLVAAYHAETRRSDRLVGRLLEGLKRLGRDATTIVALHADHGIGLDGAEIGRRSFGDETLRVPIVVRYPGVLGAGVERRGVLGLVDLAPTLLGLAGVAAPRAWCGRDRSGWLRGDEPRSAAAEPFLRDGWAVVRHLDRSAVRSIDWRYELDLQPDGQCGVGQLFDCRAGADASRDVARDHPEVARGLRDRFRRAMVEAGGRFSTGTLSTAMKRFLREAGYLPDQGKPRPIHGGEPPERGESR